MQSKERTHLTATRLLCWICSQRSFSCARLSTHTTQQKYRQIWTLLKNNFMVVLNPPAVALQEGTWVLISSGTQSLNTLNSVHWTLGKLHLCHEREPVESIKVGQGGGVSEGWGVGEKMENLVFAGHGSWCCRGFLEAQGLCRVCAASHPQKHRVLSSAATMVCWAQVFGTSWVWQTPNFLGWHRPPPSTPTPGAGRFKLQMIEQTPNFKYKPFSRWGLTF